MIERIARRTGAGLVMSMLILGCTASSTTVDLAETAALPAPPPAATPTAAPPATPEPEPEPEPTLPPVEAQDRVAPTLRVEPFDVIGLQPGQFETGNGDVIVDAGSATTIVLDGDEPVWFGILDGFPTFLNLAVMQPELTDRTSGGFSTIAACQDSVVVFSLTGPDELAALDLATGDIRWTAPSFDPQIACGDADVVVAQTERGMTGYDLADGSVRWSADYSPDDPLRTAATQAIVGTYDDLRAIDLATGDQLWSVGDSGSAVVWVAPDFVIADVAGDSLDAIAPSGTSSGLVAGDYDFEEIAIVADATGAPVTIDLAAIDPLSFDSGGATPTAGSVVALFGPAADGLIWAGVLSEDGAPVAALVDAELSLVAESSARLPDSLFFDSFGSRNVLTLGRVLVFTGSGEAVIIE